MLLFIFPIVSLLSQVLAAGVAVYTYRRLPRELKILSYYFFLSFFSAAGQLALALMRMHNLWISQSTMPVQYALVMIPLALWQPGRGLRTTALVLVPAYIVVWLAFLALLGDMNAMSTYMRPLAGALLIGASSTVLVRNVQDETKQVLDDPAFWVATATIIYFGGTVIFYSLVPSLMTMSLPVMRIAWSAPAMLNIIANLLYAKAFLCPARL